MRASLITAILVPAMGLLALAQTPDPNPPLDSSGKPLPFGRQPYHPPETPLGTGPYKAVMSEMPGLSAHVAYYPANLASLGNKKMPVVAWGNGACVYAGNRFRYFLTEIASYGYLVISGGPMADVSMEVGPQESPAVRPAGAPAPAPAPAPTPVASGPPAKRVTEALLTEAIDWAIKQNSDSGSRFYNKLDTSHIAVMGQSCGGLLAENIASSDPRVTALGVWNSGMFVGGDKSILDKIHAPVIIITGDEAHDVAYPNGKDDFARLDRVPVFYGWREGMQHIGTYGAANAGELGKIAPAWLEWQFRGDATAAKMFKGSDCTLCKDPAWHISRKNIQ